MSAFYSFPKSLKAFLFTVTVYGWFVPTVWVSEQLSEWMPTRQLTSTDWVIEAGAVNTSWDLVTTNGHADSETKKETPVPETMDSVPTPSAVPEKVSKSETHQSSNSQPSKDIHSDELETPIHSKKEGNKMTALRTGKVLHSHTAKRFSSKKKTARRGKCTVKNPDIKRSGKNDYSLPKSTVKHYSRHWNEASRLAHLSWAISGDGSRLGIRIRAISCRSPLKFTGLHRGDIVLSVNDHSVQSEKDLLKVYGKLLFWKKMDVKVKRGNETIILRYNIV